MTKFEEEVKRPKKAYIDPFSKRDVDFTGVAKKFTEGAQTLKEWKEYAFLLEDKLKLQQQALPVVPDFIGKLINTFGAPEDGKHINYSASYLEIQKELDWIDNHQKTWLTALLIGFRVEKPQLFEVKMPIVYWDDDASQLTNGFDFLRIDKETDEVDFVGFLSNTKKHTVHLTEQEIKSIDERYWQFAVPVEDGE